ncbi:MAG TPA: hypothetical protein VGR28_13580 [Candidatus Thermoplasmatota archaeon]|jgi:hypothetical protein|nr:hypothetical protein [Candidatus Thermoplasmatota archaeon]
MLRALLLAALVASSSAAAWQTPSTGRGGAGPDDEPTMPMFFAWPKATLRVLLVPPAHGPVYSGLPPDGEPPLEAIDGTYLRASLDAMRDWDAAIDFFAATHPEQAWLQGVSWQLLVASGEGAGVLADELNQADVVVLYQETLGAVMGLTWNGVRPTPLGMQVDSPHPVCVINNGQWLGYSFTYADMYNIHGHEFGHCLGVLHANVAHDVMDGEYDHWPTPATAAELHCMSNLDVAGLALSFGEALGHPPTETTARVDVWERYPLRAGCEGL